MIFDKDGTLVDANTWDAVTGDLIDRLAATDAERRAAASALEYDLERRRFLPNADLLAESNEKWIARLAPHVAGGSEPDFGRRVEATTAELVSAGVIPMAGANDLLTKLSACEITVAMATNDSEASAAAQVEQLGWTGHFAAIVGYDSGFGAKPQPGMLMGVLNRFDIAADEALMVGDTWADVQSAAAAGITFCLLDPDGQARSRLAADIVVASLSELDALLFT